MKINDKSLAYYAVLPTSIDKQGFLGKKGEVNHSYKTRWFVLKGNLLFYFEKPADKQPIGVIILENCSVEVSDSDRYAFKIRYQNVNPGASARTYILCANNEIEMETWIRCISSASFIFINMIVQEFEKSVLQLEKSDNSKTTSTNEKNSADSDNNDLHSVPLHMKSSSYDNILCTNGTDSRKSPVSSPKSFRTLDLMSAVYKGKNRFKSLDTRTKSKAIETLNRSRSNENIHKITTSKSLSQVKRKTKNQNSKKGYQSYNIPIDTNGEKTFDDDEYAASTFEALHTSYGAAIWTKIGEVS